jgi:hypothetical protein
VAIRGLRRPAVPAPVVCDDPVTVTQEEQQLRVPVVRGKRPSMTEDDGLARAPVLVEDLRSVLCGDGACTHGIISSFLLENVLL